MKDTFSVPPPTSHILLGLMVKEQQGGSIAFRIGKLKDICAGSRVKLNLGSVVVFGKKTFLSWLRLLKASYGEDLVSQDP